MCRAGGRRCNGSSNHRTANTHRQRRSRARRAVTKAVASGDTDAITQARQRLDALTTTADATTRETTVDNTHDNTGQAADNPTGDNAWAAELARMREDSRQALAEADQAIRDNADPAVDHQAAEPRPTATRDVTPHGHPDRFPIGTIHGDIGRVIVNPTGPVIANNHFGGGDRDERRAQRRAERDARRAERGSDTPNGRVTNIVNGQNHGQQTDVVNGGITFHGPGRGFTIGHNTAGAQRDVTPPTPPAARPQPAPRLDTGPGTGPVEITDANGHPIVQAGNVTDGVWIDGRRVQ